MDYRKLFDQMILQPLPSEHTVSMAVTALMPVLAMSSAQKPRASYYVPLTEGIMIYPTGHRDQPRPCRLDVTLDGHHESPQVDKDAVALWLSSPAVLLKIALEGLVAAAEMYRARVLGNVPVDEAARLRYAGANLAISPLFPGIPQKMSEVGAPGMTQDAFEAEIVSVTRRDMLIFSQFQRERDMVNCARSVQISTVLAPQLRLALAGTYDTVFLALAILYCFDLVPANWLPNCPHFCQTVQLCNLFHGGTFANPSAACTRIQTQLAEWTAANQ